MDKVFQIGGSLEEQRRSDRPLKGHADIGEKILEVEDTIDNLMRQIDALTVQLEPYTAQREALIQKMIPILREYKNGVIIAKNTLFKLKEGFERSSRRNLAYGQYIEYLLKELRALSEDAFKKAKEAEKTFWGTTVIEPDVDIQRLESSSGNQRFEEASKLSNWLYKIYDWLVYWVPGWVRQIRKVSRQTDSLLDKIRRA